MAAPAVAAVATAALTSVGVGACAAQTAVGAVGWGIATYGLGMGVFETGQNIANGDWDAVAYGLGSAVGGGLITGATGFGAGGPRIYCFVAGTEVLSRDGPKNIEDIEVGDYVLAFDEETGENKFYRVVDVFRNKVDTVVDLTVRDEEGNESVISGTPEHPFYVPADGEYMGMGDLNPGTELQTVNGSLAVVVGSETRQGEFTVYNFEVESLHNYYVAAPDTTESARFVLVHNDCPEARRIIRREPGKFGIYRIDPPNTNIPGSQWHAHSGPGRGSPALNLDGSFKDGVPTFNRRALEFLESHGWNINP